METSACVIPRQRGHCSVHGTLCLGAIDKWSSFGAGTVVFLVSLRGPDSETRVGQKLTPVE